MTRKRKNVEAAPEDVPKKPFDGYGFVQKEQQHEEKRNFKTFPEKNEQRGGNRGNRGGRDGFRRGGDGKRQFGNRDFEKVIIDVFWKF
uniref:Uncharacterized protein n=1 Tax=Caenorhabditis japonica TaxID=281687 RepID=A0A8R1IJT3_CAEJA